MTPGASCVACHLAEHEEFRNEHVTTTPEQHAASGFALSLPHDKQVCADCHDPEGRDFAARYPGRGADECSACHDDPHGGQFAEGPFSKGDCIACHDREHFEPHAFTVEKHSLAAFALSGAHLTTECNDCHTDPPADQPREFRDTPAKCDGCHDDAHQGFFDRIEAQLARAQDGKCSRCHATETFDDVPAERFDHGKWTGFPVLGAHAQAGCEACHEPRKEEDERWTQVRSRRGALRQVRGLRHLPRGSAPRHVRRPRAPARGRRAQGLRALPRRELVPRPSRTASTTRSGRASR
jgi:hypothetical protein